MRAAERNPRTNAWTLRGKGPEIVRLRDEDGLTFGEIGEKMHVTTEGARQAYWREIESRTTPNEEGPGGETRGAITEPAGETSEATITQSTGPTPPQEPE